jgi:hypothetical protein
LQEQTVLLLQTAFHFPVLSYQTRHGMASSISSQDVRAQFLVFHLSTTQISLGY